MLRSFLARVLAFLGLAFNFHFNLNATAHEHIHMKNISQDGGGDETCKLSAALIVSIHVPYTDNSLSSFQLDQLVAIQVDDAEETYFVPKHILLKSSEYFEGALQGQFIETKQQKLRLPGCDTTTLHLFLNWLCNRTLSTLCDELYELTDGDVEDDSQEVRQAASKLQVILVKLWVFGEAYLMPKLQNETMECFLDLLQNGFISTDAVHVAFELTASDMFRRMIAKEVAQWQRRGCYSDEEIDGLGTIDGFFKITIKVLEECHRTGCRHQCDEVGCAPSFADFHKPYVVDEKKSS